MQLLLKINGFSTQSPVTSNFFNRTFPLQYLNIAKHRNDIPKGLKTMQLVKKLRTQEKYTHFNERLF